MDSGIAFSEDILFGVPGFRQDYEHLLRLKEQKRYQQIIEFLLDDKKGGGYDSLRRMDPSISLTDSFKPASCGNQAYFQNLAFKIRTDQPATDSIARGEGMLLTELLDMERGIMLLEVLPDEDLKVLYSRAFDRLKCLRELRKDKRHYLTILRQEQRKIDVTREN